MMNGYRILTLITFVFLMGHVFYAHSAQFRLSGEYSNHIFFTGDITQSDVSTMEEALDRIVKTNPDKSGLWKRPVFVSINSRGGDWDAAMKIGRLLRKNSAEISVDKNEYCLSACIMVLVGAPIRVLMPGAIVGIHRPYSTRTGNISMDEAQKRYRLLETSTRSYLQEMNMPNGMFDAMINVPSEKIRILSEKELAEYRLDSNDPAAQEVDDASWAAYYKLTKQEYLVRKSLVSKKCDPLLPSLNEFGRSSLEKSKKFLSCKDAIFKAGNQ